MPRPSVQLAERLVREGRLADAERECRRVLASSSSNVGARRVLGEVLRLTGRAEEAVALLGQLFRERPQDARVATELGASLVVCGRAGQAIAMLSGAAAKLPDSPEPYKWLGRGYLQSGDVALAAGALQQAVSRGADIETKVLLATAYMGGGDPSAAREMLEAALGEHGSSPPLVAALAQAMEQSGDLVGASARYGELLGASHADGGSAGAGLVRCLHGLGRTEEAHEVAAREYERHGSLESASAFALTLLPRGEAQRAAEILALHAGERPEGPQAMAAMFLLGQACEALGRVDEAFDAYARANSAYGVSFNAEGLEAQHAAWRAAAEMPRASGDLGGRCVFIVGMPRSGTTLVEQILDSHPGVHGAGELSTLRDVLIESAGGRDPSRVAALGRVDEHEARRIGEAYVERVSALGPGSGLIVDKMPHNFELVGVIARVLPGARIIHCRRHPLDTCLSIFKTQLSPAHAYATDQEHLGAAYARYVELMAHWGSTLDEPVLDVFYEEVVGDLPGQTARVLEHVGLAWDDACARFWENRRTIKTASVDQVRKPIYRSSVGSFEKFRHRLGPLIEALERAGVPMSECPGGGGPG